MTYLYPINKRTNCIDIQTLKGSHCDYGTRYHHPYTRRPTGHLLRTDNMCFELRSFDRVGWTTDPSWHIGVTVQYSIRYSILDLARPRPSTSAERSKMGFACNIVIDTATRVQSCAFTLPHHHTHHTAVLPPRCLYRASTAASILLCCWRR